MSAILLSMLDANAIASLENEATETETVPPGTMPLVRLGERLHIRLANSVVPPLRVDTDDNQSPSRVEVTVAGRGPESE